MPEELNLARYCHLPEIEGKGGVCQTVKEPERSGPTADPRMVWLYTGPTADLGYPRVTCLMRDSLLCIVKATS